MEQNDLQYYSNRIGLNTDLSNISIQICKRYDLGDFISNKLITIGYEDYNYCLTTTKGKYCVKILNKDRSREEINDYVERIRTVANSDISSPKPLLIDGDITLSMDYDNNHYELIVFEYINGKNYYEVGDSLSPEDIKEIARQISLIHDLDYKPNYIYDSWAIINFKREYAKKREYLPDNYKLAFDELLNEFNSIDFDRLPKAFIHGDISSTNVMRDENGKLWIIDFAVSNYLPRIMELAVTACALCLDKGSKDKTCENIALLLNEYSKYKKLSDYEKQAFVVFYKIANAMYIIQTQYSIATYGDSDENQFLFNKGVLGYSLSENERLTNFIK